MEVGSSSPGYTPGYVLRTPYWSIKNIYENIIMVRGGGGVLHF